MNIIIDKLNLCEDMKREIISYCYNREGYNIEEINYITKKKSLPRNIFMNNRIKIELAEWKKYGVSVSWLRGGGVYSPGISIYGGPKKYEGRLLMEAYNRKLLRKA